MEEKEMEEKEMEEKEIHEKEIDEKEIDEKETCISVLQSEFIVFRATGIDVEILGPDDGPVALSKGNDGSIAFTSTMGGDYTICFHSRSTSWFGSVTNLKVIFNIKTNEDAIDYDEIAKADHLDSIEVSIRRLHDKIRGIRHEQEYMKSREIEFHAVGESTNNRVFYFSTLQVLILIGTAFFQLHHLKRYLKEQKVI
eukprot:TRINITY_DN3495_c0_g1_i2.p1 TRINITY_DN3495_c0_g1~~TRINITY_DN3495_c0_g1_i2.p1  ORF type:complete len:204 (+),score=64.67 TRINITY_DN3495_c0_g1_i2:22-612(+)